MYKKRLIGLWTIVVLSLTSAFAQDETIRVETNLVTVNVSITDKNGNHVYGLKHEDFEIFDDDVKQKIEHFSAGEAPVSYGIIYDMHPTTEDRTKAVLDSLNKFTKEMRPEDDFFLIAFNMRGSLKLEFIPTIEQIRKHLPRSRQPNALYDAIYDGAEHIKTSRNLKRILLVISDSADHQSRHNFNEISRKLKGIDAQVYAVVFDENARWIYEDVTRGGKESGRFAKEASELDRAAMQELTLKSGGTTHFPVALSGFYLYSIYKQIADEIGKQYMIGFYPETVDGKWHDLRVNLRGVKGSKKFAFSYRPGYQSYSPKSVPNPNTP